MNDFGQPIDNDPHAFWQEARYQRLCAVCGHGGSFHAHHVYPRDKLKRMGAPEWDTRNALRLCELCHMQFEWAGAGKVEIVTSQLKQQNLCYLWELLNVGAYVFLDREYGGSDDPRFTCHASGLCLDCQLHASAAPAGR